MKLHPTLIYNNILNIVENRDILDENESKKHMTIQASTCFFFFFILTKYVSKNINFTLLILRRMMFNNFQEKTSSTC